MWTDLQNKRRGGFATLIPEGERAWTIRVTHGVSSSLLQPNDTIDIIGSFAVPRPSSLPSDTAPTWRERSDIINIVLLQNVTILARGDVYGFSSNGKGTARDELTVSVTLEEAQLLMFAAQHGQLGSVLRKSHKSGVVDRADLPKVTFQRLEELIGTLDKERKERTIEIYHGEDRRNVVIKEEDIQEGMDEASE